MMTVVPVWARNLLKIPFQALRKPRLSMGLRGSLRWACEVFSPVAAPSRHFEVSVIRKAQLDCMEPGMGRWGMEAEDAAIWEVISESVTPLQLVTAAISFQSGFLPPHPQPVRLRFLYDFRF
jgi:hypothetical protein